MTKCERPAQKHNNSLLFDLLYLQETGAAAMSASVVKMVPSIKEGDQKFELYQEEVEHVKVCYVQ